MKAVNFKNSFTGMITPAILLILTAMPAELLASEQLLLRAEQWEIARHGERLVKIPVLRKIISSWSTHNSQKIELHYPGGEEGELWVEELMDWLVSLGVPSNTMIAVPGSGAEDIIRFKILKVGE